MSGESNNNFSDEKYQQTYKEFNFFKKFKKVYKIILLCLLFIYVIFIIIYFSLPVFKLSGIKYEGLVNLQKEDIITLLDESPNKSLLFFNSNSKKELLLSNSKGAILDDSVSISIDSFSGYIKVTEDYPVAIISDQLYFSTSRTFSEYQNNLNNTNLSDSSKSRIISCYAEYADNTKHLPNVSLPSNYLASKENITSALTYLKGCDLNTLTNRITNIKYVKYKNVEDTTTNFNAVCEIYVDSSYNDNKYSFVIENIRSNLLSDILDEETFENSLSEINSAIKGELRQNKNLYKSSYFLDDNKSQEIDNNNSNYKENVYHVRFRYYERTSTSKASFSYELEHDSCKVH